MIVTLYIDNKLTDSALLRCASVFETTHTGVALMLTRVEIVANVSGRLWPKGHANTSIVFGS